LYGNFVLFGFIIIFDIYVGLVSDIIIIGL